MSKTFSRRQKTLNLLIKDKQLRKISGWLLLIAIVVLLWSFNWKLFLATTVGMSLMGFSYLLQNPYWQRYCQKWQSFLAGSNRQLILAVGSGAIGSFCTYLAASIWADAENQWLATGAILQGFASLTTLSVLFWSLRQKKDNHIETEYDRLVTDLSDLEPLKRLVAIRQLTRLLLGNNLAADYYSQSVEYFQLMLGEERSPAVENALLESLELLDFNPTSQLSKPKVRIPLKIKDYRLSNE